MLVTKIVIMLIGGLAFFLYGMNVMSSGLERVAGGKLEKTLKTLTSNPIKSLALGAGITVAIQSSSAMTVMLVGLVNSGIMTIGQTVGVIMGSNIGTTLTAWITSLVGIDAGSSLVMMLLKPEMFSLVLAFIGAAMIMLSKNAKSREIGAIFVGFAVLMYGMKLMGEAMKPLQEMEGFTSMLTAFNNPILGVLIGAVFTGIIQSSAASVAILQTLALSGGVTYEMAIPIIMGQNIGTCVTALISSIGVSRNAKKVAVVHISFNMIGTIVLLSVYYGLNAFIEFGFSTMAINAQGIAVVHSVFNVVTTLLLLPFSKLLVKIANFVFRDTNESTDAPKQLLDERLFATPSFAVAECNNLTIKMAQVAKETLSIAIDNMQNYNASSEEKIQENETILDNYEDEIGTYLVRLSAKSLSENDSHSIGKMLHAIGDFERLGDHAVNISKVAKELAQKNISFSEQAQQQLLILTDALREILEITVSAYTNNDKNIASQVEPLEQVVDELVASIKNKHIQRLQSGNCTIEMGFILSDLLNNYERVSDHCSNIAVSIIDVLQDSYESHKYLNDVKYSDENFKLAYEKYRSTYKL